MKYIAGDVQRENKAAADTVAAFLAKLGKNSVCLFFVTDNPDGVAGKDAVMACFTYNMRVPTEDALRFIGAVLTGRYREGEGEGSDAAPPTE